MMVKIIKYLPNPEATLFTTVYRKTLIHESSIYKGYLAHFLTSALKTFPKKNFWYFFLKKLALKKRHTFDPDHKKIKKFAPRKWKFLTLTLKNFLYFTEQKSRKIFYFFQRKLFLYFRERKPRKSVLYFRKWKSEKIIYTSGNEIFLYFRNFQNLGITDLSYISRKAYAESWHNGTFLIYQEKNI